MNTSTNGTLNTTLVRDYCCAQCFGPLVEKFIEGQGWVVVCAQPQPCQPGGFVTIKGAERRASQDIADYHEVAANYPELAQRVKMPKENRQAMKRAMFGE